MTNATTPSSRDVEREADQKRAELSSTLEQLRDRLTPGQIVDDMLSGSSVHASKFLSNLGTSVRDHPVPALLIGAGLAMMMTGTPSMSSFGRSKSRRYTGDLHDDARGYDRFEEDSFDGYEGARSYGSSRRGSGIGSVARAAVDGVKSAAGAVSSGISAVKGAASTIADTASSLAGAASSTASSITGTASSLADQASDLASRTRSGAMSAMDQAQGLAGSVSGTVSEGVSGMRSSVSDMRHRAGRGSRVMANEAERLTHYLAEQPLVLTALGAAIGAALGAAMPRTRMENEYLGEASDRFKETAQEMAKEQYDNAKRVAGEAFEDVKAQAEEQGLSVEGVKAAAGEVGDKLAAVADHATSKIKKEAESMAKSASGSSEAGSSASSSMGSSGGGTARSTSGSGAGSSGGAGQSVSPTSTTGSETSSRKPSQGSPQPSSSPGASKPGASTTPR